MTAKEPAWSITVNVYYLMTPMQTGPVQVRRSWTRHAPHAARRWRLSSRRTRGARRSTSWIDASRRGRCWTAPIPSHARDASGRHRPIHHGAPAPPVAIDGASRTGGSRRHSRCACSSSSSSVRPEPRDAPARDAHRLTRRARRGCISTRAERQRARAG